MIGAIENAILAELKAYGDGDALGYKYRTLETFPEDWSQYLQDKAVLNAPAAWVVFAGASKVGGSPAQPVLRFTFGLVVMAENARNETATRHGGPGTGEPGSFQLAEDAITILAGSELGLDIGSIEVRALRVVNRLDAAKARKVSMLAIELTTDCMLFGVDREPGALPDFEAFHANWDVPPFGNVLLPLPADATADATDHVTLETTTP
jgi:phage gp37-like protein